jgi:F-type H+-transporting ATPase subunit b
MEFDTSTFILEIINFLVLIWILQRLFYKPLLATIVQRKQHIEQSLAEAESIRQAAEAQRELYENRQKLWEQEKQTALTALHQQMDSERSGQLDKLQHELIEERRKYAVTLHRQQQEFQQRTEQMALKNGARFAGLLLQQTASAELETRLAELLLEQLVSLPEACLASLQLLDHQPAITIQITSAYPLPDTLQQRLAARFTELIAKPLVFHYQQDAALLAGLRIDIGAWVLQTNLQQELSGFAELVNDLE